MSSRSTTLVSSPNWLLHSPSTPFEELMLILTEWNGLADIWLARTWSTSLLLSSSICAAITLRRQLFVLRRPLPRPGTFCVSITRCCHWAKRALVSDLTPAPSENLAVAAPNTFTLEDGKQVGAIESSWDKLIFYFSFSFEEIRSYCILCCFESSHGLAHGLGGKMSR